VIGDSLSAGSLGGDRLDGRDADFGGFLHQPLHPFRSTQTLKEDDLHRRLHGDGDRGLQLHADPSGFHPGDHCMPLAPLAVEDRDPLPGLQPQDATNVA
jgi:hypothetical protein